jgi:hypothetical protein
LICVLEVIKAGDHTLEVGVTYLPPEAEHPRTFRKMYNFTTFDIITVRSMSLAYPNRTVIFQMEIQNTGDSPILLTKILFHDETAWDVKSCNELVKGEDLGIFRERELLPREFFQTMFILTPKKGVEGEMPFALGRLEIDWMGSMGERGNLITGVFKRRIVN